MIHNTQVVAVGLEFAGIVEGFGVHTDGHGGGGSERIAGVVGDGELFSLSPRSEGGGPASGGGAAELRLEDKEN